MKRIFSLFVAASLFSVAGKAQIASPMNCLASVISQLETKWPKNRAVNIVCHGHNVPAGYFKTPAVDSLHAYPNLLRVSLAERFPYAVINVIVTAIGGENSLKGAARFDVDVLPHNPGELVTDGCYQESPDKKWGGSWISLLKGNWEQGRIRWFPLVQHGSSWRSQDEHPHPVLSRAADAIWFTSDTGGRRAVWRLELAK